MPTQAKCELSSLFVLLAACTLLAACLPESDAGPLPIASVSPAATQLTAALEPDLQVNTPQPGRANQPTGTPVPTMAQTATKVLPPIASHSATVTQVPPPTVTRTPTASQPPPTSTTTTPEPPPQGAGAPKIITFTVSPDRISPGERATLTWETEGGESATLCSVLNLQHPGDCSDVPPVGSREIVADQDATIYMFRLTVDNSVAGYTEDIYLCINISNLFFEDPPQKCGASPPIYSYAAAQRFERGLMIWLETTDEFFIFWDDANDQTYDPFTVVSGPLQLKPGASVDNRVGDVPDGYYEPVSGFGLLWRGEVAGREALRESLGWALQPEFGFETVYQHGITSAWHYFDRYIRDPDGRARYLWGQTYLGTHWNYVEESQSE